MSITQEMKIDNSKFENFKDFVAEVFERTLAEGGEILKNTLSELDSQLMVDCDKRRYRNKGLRSTSINTELGTIEYERHICRDSQTGYSDSSFRATANVYVCLMNFTETRS